MRLTLKTVNDALAKLGSETRLFKGTGYFYFDGGESSAWLVKWVNVDTIKALSFEQWIKEFKRLRELNRGLLKGKNPSGRSRKRV